MAPPTILAHKSAFLTAQTLQLSQAFAPSPAWQRANKRSEHELPERLVDDALYRLNHTLQQHVRRVYPPQGTRAVAEQIEGLFLDVDARGNVLDNDEDGEIGERRADEELRLGVDFATDPAISSLPPTWSLHNAQEASSHPPEAHRYTDLQETLTQLSTRRAKAKARVECLRQMRSLLAPFQTTGDVQENLVARNGDMEKELERMRFLLVRVAARVAQLPDVEQAGGDEIVEDYEEVEKRKLETLLDGL